MMWLLLHGVAPMMFHGDRMTLAKLDYQAAQQVSETIRTARVGLGISKTQAADAAGGSRRTWHELEEGQRATTTAETLACIDETLRFTPGTLLAMTNRSANVELEALRQAAIEVIRRWSGPELERFVET